MHVTFFIFLSPLTFLFLPHLLFLTNNPFFFLLFHGLYSFFFFLKKISLSLSHVFSLANLFCTFSSFYFFSFTLTPFSFTLIWKIQTHFAKFLSRNRYLFVANQSIQIEILTYAIIIVSNNRISFVKKTKKKSYKLL
jgi:hypothetical protein